MVNKSSIPLNTQLELTYSCNNDCKFCYNRCDRTTRKSVSEFDTGTGKHILRQLKKAGIFSVNLNGGEPLARADFFELAQYGSHLGLDLHLNTNGNLIGVLEARYISTFFPAVCTTVLSADDAIHDDLSGRRGALADTLRGILKLQQQGVHVAVNVMICRLNASTIEATLDLLENLSIRSLLITRYVPSGRPFDTLVVDDEGFFKVLRAIRDRQISRPAFHRVSLPQPVAPCQVPVDLKRTVLCYNIACTIGLCTARICPDGSVTPCPVVAYPVLGNLHDQDFHTIWDRFAGGVYCAEEHLREKCLRCKHLPSCGGGCKGYNDAIDNIHSSGE